MKKTINILITVNLAVAAFLVYSGYYKCYSQKTVHLYGACCSDQAEVELCCSDRKDNSETRFEKKCCDKIDVQQTEQHPTGNNWQISFSLESLFIPPQPVLFINCDSLTERVYIANSQSPPYTDRQKTYKYNCSYLC